MQKTLRFLAAIILIGFGLLTLFLSISIIFDFFNIRAKEGNYVLFIVWANFISSILYLFSAYGFLKLKSWTRFLLIITSFILSIAFIFFLMHISQGGIYETKTVNAMIFRTCLTIIFAILAHYTIQKVKKKTTQ